MATTIEQPTEIGKQNISAIDEGIKRAQKYITFEEGEERDLHFDAERIKAVPNRFGGNERYECTVTDLTYAPDLEKTWTVSRTVYQMIKEHLLEGNTILHIEAEGQNINRKYKVSVKK
jgi:hypothetical protein